MKPERIVIFGAQSFACGVYKAVQKLYPQYNVECFMVTRLEGNPETLCGLQVKSVSDHAQSLSAEDKMQSIVLVATPEDLFAQIVKTLNAYEFSNIELLDSKRYAKLMAEYYDSFEDFLSLNQLPMGDDRVLPEVYQVKFYKDKEITNGYKMPKWCVPIQVGAALTDVRVADVTDSTGINISHKNPNYCELTALYWIWKNKLPFMDTSSYVGIFHYRRLLNISENDLFGLEKNNIDVILPYPTIHEKGIYNHHTRYVKEADWEVMRQALEEKQPQYAAAFQEIFEREYFYNYNILIARRNVIEDFCRWLFSVLERTEELSTPKGWERGDRYTAYMGESLTTLYFMYHKKDLNIVHAGIHMLT